MTIKKHRIFGVAISVGSVIFAFIAYWFLPEKIPMQWDLSGEISTYANKAYVFFLGILPGGFYWLLGIAKKIDLKKANYSRFSKAYEIIRTSFCVYLLLMLIIVVYSSTSPNGIKMDFVMCLLLGALICTLGNYMPKIKPNFVCGIKTPWTISNDKVWVKTHRLAGKLWFVAGIILMGASFVFSKGVLFCIIMAMMAMLVLIPLIYSYVLYQKS